LTLFPISNGGNHLVRVGGAHPILAILQGHCASTCGNELRWLMVHGGFNALRPAHFRAGGRTIQTVQSYYF